MCLVLSLQPFAPQGIWRNYQYQHLYNLAQMRLRSSDRKFCFYVGLTYLNPEMRGKQILQYFMYDILRVCLEWCKEQELHYLTNRETFTECAWKWGLFLGLHNYRVHPQGSQAGVGRILQPLGQDEL